MKKYSFELLRQRRQRLSNEQSGEYARFASRALFVLLPCGAMAMCFVSFLWKHIVCFIIVRKKRRIDLAMLNALWAKALSRLHEKRFQGTWATQSLEAKLPFKSIATLKLTYFLAILSLTSFQLHAIDYCWIESRCSNRLLCFARFGYYADSFILSGGVFANSSSVRRNDKVFLIGGMDIIFYRMKSYERMKKTLFVWLYIQIRRRDLAGCSCGTLKIQVRTHFA